MMDDEIFIAIVIIGIGLYALVTLIKRIKETIHEKRMLIEKEEYNQIAKYERLIKEAKKIRTEAIEKAERLERYNEKLMARMEWYISEKCDSYPHLAGLKADLLTQHYEQSARYLEIKKRPAYTEAKRIRELKKETKQILLRSKELEYKIEYIRALFPNIDDIFDKDFNEEESFSLETEENTDRVRLFLSPEEYNQLPTAEKNQLAMDRYLSNRKSKWQIGRDYEMYIGYLYESKGYRVQYTGIIKKLEDMGRDLIVAKEDKTMIIQCKRWSQEKTIHEKHIFQLFGTVTLYNIDHPERPAKGVFVSTTKLSETAAKIAKELNIQVSYQKMGEFPRIKCNLGKNFAGAPEKIYHLPFDQQYDRVIIDPQKGEFFAMTVKEAEDAGYRRAYKWFGIDT